MNDHLEIQQKLDNLQNQLGQISAQPINQEGSVNFVELWHKIWKGKIHIAIVTFIFAAASIIVVLIIPDKYQSEVLLAPVADTEGGIADMISKVGGLASLAGLKLGKNKLTKSVLAVEILKSRSFIKFFIEKHNLLVPLMAANGWDRNTNELLIDDDKYDLETNTWVRNVSPPKQVIPSDREAHEEFLEKLNVSEGENSLVTISIKFYSPEIAKQWVDWLVKDLNEHVKNQDREDAQKSIQYLQNELELTTLAKMHAIFYQLIEEQTKIIMLANVRAEYVFKIVDPAVVPDEKESPRRSVIVILVTLLGGILGAISVLIRDRKSTA